MSFRLFHIYFKWTEEHKNELLNELITSELVTCLLMYIIVLPSMPGHDLVINFKRKLLLLLFPYIPALFVVVKAVEIILKSISEQKI